MLFRNSLLMLLLLGPPCGWVPLGSRSAPARTSPENSEAPAEGVSPGAARLQTPRRSAALVRPQSVPCGLCVRVQMEPTCLPSAVLPCRSDTTIQSLVAECRTREASLPRTQYSSLPQATRERRLLPSSACTHMYTHAHSCRHTHAGVFPVSTVPGLPTWPDTAESQSWSEWHSFPHS